MARHVLKGPGDMFTFRQALAFWAAVLVLTVATAEAQAQATTTAAPTISVTTTGVTHTAKRSANRPTGLINHADCLADDVMTFPVTATNFSSYSFQVWVGTQDCTVLTNRSAAYQYCWQVLNTTFAQLNSGSNTTGSTTVQLHVRSLIDGYTHLFDGTTPVSTAGAGGTSGTAGSGGADTTTAGIGGTAGATTTITSGVVNAGVEACDQPNPQNVVGATTLTVYFMLVDPSTSNTAASIPWTGTFKLIGPQPPDVISAGIGGNLLVVNFSYSASVTTDLTRNGYAVFCDPPPGSDAAVDAGLVGDSGVGSAVVCPDPVASSVLVPGNDPPVDSQYRCGGSGQATSQSVNATNLIDGVPYNVAVSAVDSYENTGPLSTLACQVPQPISGFYKVYRDAGGQAGGGLCSMSNKREPILLLTVLGIAACLVLRRRRAA